MSRKSNAQIVGEYKQNARVLISKDATAAETAKAKKENKAIEKLLAERGFSDADIADLRSRAGKAD
jgi:hypothetical protein